jgi:collagen type III alpha
MTAGMLALGARLATAGVIDKSATASSTGYEIGHWDRSVVKRFRGTSAESKASITWSGGVVAVSGRGAIDSPLGKHGGTGWATAAESSRDANTQSSQGSSIAGDRGTQSGPGGRSAAADLPVGGASTGGSTSDPTSGGSPGSPSVGVPGASGKGSDGAEPNVADGVSSAVGPVDENPGGAGKQHGNSGPIVATSNGQEASVAQADGREGQHRSTTDGGSPTANSVSTAGANGAPPTGLPRLSGGSSTAGSGVHGGGGVGEGTSGPGTTKASSDGASSSAGSSKPVKTSGAMVSGGPSHGQGHFRKHHGHQPHGPSMSSGSAAGHSGGFSGGNGKSSGHGFVSGGTDGFGKSSGAGDSDGAAHSADESRKSSIAHSGNRNTRPAGNGH